ncbi:MAG: hypothetical protein RJA61_553 [Candidatus Parcubacteria bacterium]|jgi:hypothetical protein
MQANQDQKDIKNHKFPRLQKEVDSILEMFDSISLSIDGEVYDEKLEFEHLNVDDVMAGKTQKITHRTRHSVVEKARKDEKIRIAKQVNTPHEVSVQTIHAERYFNPPQNISSTSKPQNKKGTLSRAVSFLVRHLEF